jgi:protein-S-isoprenylcysteine O-methyltransferase Ste14
MKATNWEFKHRALIFGLIIGLAFSLYNLDSQNVTALLAHWLGTKTGLGEDHLTHLLLAFTACVLIAAALLRTWASSYLRATVVYAAEVKTETLVADGPYRRVRNPLYFANVLMAVGLGALMSRSGLLVVMAAMLGFCYRLILLEESELKASQGDSYDRYAQIVPRLWPSLRPRIAAAGSHPRWGLGFQAEGWYWGFAVAVAAFAITLNVTLMLVIVGASIAVFWMSSTLLRKKPDSRQN